MSFRFPPAATFVALRNLGWFEVVEQRGLIKEGQVAEFQVTIKVGFKLED